MSAMDIAVIEQFRKLFRGREDAHGRFTALPDGGKKVNTERFAPSPEVWEQHLMGEGPFLGIVPIRKDNLCYFGAIDVDNHGEDQDVNIAALEAAIRQFRLPLVACRSKSGGVHLYLFCREPIPAKLVVSCLDKWLKLLKPKHSCEIFPKQTKIKEGDIGNWINLPYYGGNNSNRYAVVDGEPVDLAAFLAHANANLVTEASLMGLDEAEGGDDHPFRHGPPCLATLHVQGLPSGERNKGLYNVAVYFKITDPDSWQYNTKKWNDERCDPPMSAEEVAGVIRSVNEHENYKYTCKDDPINSVCQKSKCVKRRFGVSFWHSEEIEAAMPEIVNLTVLKTDPPRYFVKVDGMTVETSSDSLLKYNQFKLRVMEVTKILMPMLKQYEWEERLHPLLQTATEVEAPPDAGTLGQFKFHLLDFLSRRREGETDPKELLRGMPFEKNGHVYFRGPDFYQFLEQHRFRDYSKAEVFSALHKLGAESKPLKVGKENVVRAWFLPTPTEGFETEAREVPRVEEDPDRRF